MEGDNQFTTGQVEQVESQPNNDDDKPTSGSQEQDADPSQVDSQQDIHTQTSEATLEKIEGENEVSKSLESGLEEIQHAVNGEQNGSIQNIDNAMKSIKEVGGDGSNLMNQSEDEKVDAEENDSKQDISKEQDGELESPNLSLSQSSLSSAVEVVHDNHSLEFESDTRPKLTHQTVKRKTPSNDALWSTDQSVCRTSDSHGQESTQSTKKVKLHTESPDEAQKICTEEFAAGGAVENVLEWEKCPALSMDKSSGAIPKIFKPKKLHPLKLYIPPIGTSTRTSLKSIQPTLVETVKNDRTLFSPPLCQWNKTESQRIVPCLLIPDQPFISTLLPNQNPIPVCNDLPPLSTIDVDQNCLSRNKKMVTVLDNSMRAKGSQDILHREKQRPFYLNQPLEPLQEIEEHCSQTSDVQPSDNQPTSAPQLSASSPTPIGHKFPNKEPSAIFTIKYRTLSKWLLGAPRMALMFSYRFISVVVYVVLCMCKLWFKIPFGFLRFISRRFF